MAIAMELTRPSTELVEATQFIRIQTTTDLYGGSMADSCGTVVPRTYQKVVGECITAGLEFESMWKAIGNMIPMQYAWIRNYIEPC